MSESPQDIIARLSEYWEYDTDHLTCAARDCIIEQGAEIARLQALLENAIDHHYAALCVVRGNLDDSYKPMAEGMKSACNRWRSALPNSKMRSYYE